MAPVLLIVGKVKTLKYGTVLMFLIHMASPFSVYSVPPKFSHSTLQLSHPIFHNEYLLYLPTWYP